MILGVSGFMGSPGGGDAIESGAGSGGSSDVGASSSIPGGIAEENERSGGGVGRGGSRWPRQETLALLKIRSDMDVAFRDASLKAPLWEEVSRKMAELGFQRSTKKCKEKFENVFKYHKRTKDGRAVKPDGKSYRFFDQLEALENNPTNLFTPPPQPPQRPPATAAMTAPVNFQIPPLSSSLPTSPTPLNILPPNISQFQPSQPPLQPPPTTSIPHSFHHISASLISNTTSSSSTSSDEGIQRPRGRKRKWKDYLERLMRDVIQKQEELQKKFLETLEKRERDRISREDAWRLQEMARMNREHEIMVQERSIAAAKDAAVIAFLQKVTDQQHISPTPMPMPVSITLPPQMPIQVQPVTVTNPPPLRPTITEAPAVVTAIAPTHLEIAKRDNGGDSFALTPSSSSRWPKPEVQALIKLRTNLDLKYQENVPKGPLWEEISSAMAKLGYNRSSKRCKEKWENINKYYKKVKENSKKRPEDSKTCPYFHQLDAIYRERAKPELPSLNPGFTTKQDNTMAPIMARPEQQWPQQDQQNQGINDNDDMDDDEEEEEEGEGGGGYRIITNHQPTAQGEMRDERSVKQR